MAESTRKPADKPGSYLVVAVGVSYANDDATLLGLQGQVISLDDDEAMRLLLLGAVSVATEQDVADAAERARVRAEQDAVLVEGVNGPYGGSPLDGGTFSEAARKHAAKQILEAHKVSAQAG